MPLKVLQTEAAKKLQVSKVKLLNVLAEGREGTSNRRPKRLQVSKGKLLMVLQTEAANKS